jgi:hypothetical protein
VIRNVLFTDEAHFTRHGVNNTRNSHLWGRDNPHGTIESNYQQHERRTSPPNSQRCKKHQQRCSAS